MYKCNQFRIRCWEYRFEMQFIRRILKNMFKIYPYFHCEHLFVMLPFVIVMVDKFLPNKLGSSEWKLNLTQLIPHMELDTQLNLIIKKPKLFGVYINSRRE